MKAWYLFGLIVLAILIMISVAFASRCRHSCNSSSCEAPCVHLVSTTKVQTGLSEGSIISTFVKCPKGKKLVGGGAYIIETGPALDDQIMALQSSIPLECDTFFGSAIVVEGPANAALKVTAVCADC